VAWKPAPYNGCGPLSLTFWPWSGTFKFQHTIYVKCEYFMNLKMITFWNTLHFVEE